MHVVIRVTGSHGLVEKINFKKQNKTKYFLLMLEMNAVYEEEFS